MGILDNLNDSQRQILFIGAPAVAVLALVSAISKRGGGSSSSGAQLVPAVAASTDVVGVGQLAEFESMVTSAINQQSYDISELTNAIDAMPDPYVPDPVQPLPNVLASAFPITGVPDTAFEVIGSITGSGGLYSGLNVKGGAPVYAYQNGEWKQNFDADKLAVGTALGTPSVFRDYIVPGTVSQDL